MAELLLYLVVVQGLLVIVLTMRVVVLARRLRPSLKGQTWIGPEK